MHSACYPGPMRSRATRAALAACLGFVAGLQAGCQFDDGRLSERCDEERPCPAGGECVRGLCQAAVPSPADMLFVPPPLDAEVSAPDAAPPRPMADLGSAPPDARPLEDATPPDPIPDLGLPDAKVEPDAMPAPLDAMPPDPPRNLMVTPSDDTFADSRFSERVVGESSPVLSVSRGLGRRNEAYFRFPLDFTPPEQARIRARLSVSVQFSPVEVQEDAALRLSSVEANWTEGELTWGNRPASISAFPEDSDQSPERGDRARWEVGPEVERALRMGASHVSFNIRAHLDDDEGLSQWSLYSKESNEDERPRLEISW